MDLTGDRDGVKPRVRTDSDIERIMDEMVGESSSSDDDDDEIVLGRSKRGLGMVRI